MHRGDFWHQLADLDRRLDFPTGYTVSLGPFKLGHSPKGRPTETVALQEGSTAIGSLRLRFSGRT